MSARVTFRVRSLAATFGLFRSPWLRTGGAVLGFALLCVAVEACGFGPRVAPFLSSRQAELPSMKVGLVLGCSSQLPDGRNNLFFERRIAAAAALFHGGKVQFLLASGDNSHRGYDEPSDMRRALIAAGVPASRIVLDYAGFRTLDSVLRARDVFGLDELIVVSQRFHNERAVYLARSHGIRAYGYDARDVGGAGGLRTHAREVLSRLVAVLDVKLLHSRPRFSGPRETTPF